FLYTTLFPSAANFMTPNHVNIAVSDAFYVPLISVMAAGVIPGIFGLIAAYIIAKRISSRGTAIQPEEVDQTDQQTLPSLATSLLGPLIAILLLALRPLF